MKHAKETFNYHMQAPRIVYVKSHNLKDWEFELETGIGSKDQAVVLIIPGSHGKSELYNDLKSILYTKIPVPSQIILTGTLIKGRT